MFFTNLIGPCICPRWKKQEKLSKVYELTDENLTRELDIVKILKDLRTNKILLSNTILDEATKF